MMKNLMIYWGIIATLIFNLLVDIVIFVLEWKKSSTDNENKSSFQKILKLFPLIGRMVIIFLLAYYKDVFLNISSSTNEVL